MSPLRLIGPICRRVSVIRSRFAGTVYLISLDWLLAIIITQAALAFALAVTIYWSISQAESFTVRGQALYKIGWRDGEALANRRAELARDLQASAEIYPPQSVICK
jgi:hypothetical protein